MRCDIPPRFSASWREPVSIHTPTATERTCSMRSVTIRMPLGKNPFRYASITCRLSGPRRVRRGRVLELLLVGEGRLIAQSNLPAQPHLPIAVDLDDLDEHLVALGQDVLDRADPALGDLRAVEGALGGGNDLDEGTEFDDLLDLAEIDAVELDLTADVLDDAQRLLHRRAVGREHGDPPVVLDIDLGAGLLLDAPDDLTAGTDDLANLLGPDLDRDEARRVGRELGARLLDGLAHLRENDQPGLARLLQRRAHDVDRYAADLDVHLERGHALLGTRDLEVHVAVVVLGAVAVGEDADAVAFLHQAHRDAGHVRLERHARVHQSQRGAAHGRHRRRAVRLEDVGNDPDGVRKLFLRRQDGFDRSLGEGPVADVSAGR